MQNDIQSHNTKTRIGLTGRDYLVPSGSQVLIYALISLLILIGLNLDHIWRYLNDVVLAPQGGLDTFIKDTLPGLHNLLNDLARSTILQVVFWIFIGTAVYVIVWFVRNMFVNLTNDVVADNYLHPTSYNRGNFWASVLGRKVFFGITLLTLVMYLYASFEFLPILANEAYQAIIMFRPFKSVLEIIEATVGVVIWLHLLLLLIHTAMNSWRVINHDL